MWKVFFLTKTTIYIRERREITHIWRAHTTKKQVGWSLVDAYSYTNVAYYTALTTGLALPLGPFYWHSLTFIPVWISNLVQYQVWDEINYPFLNFNGATGDSVADMWQKVAGIFTSGGKYQIWYIRVLMYAESKKIGRQAVKSTEPFHIGVCLWHISFLIKLYSLGSALYARWGTYFREKCSLKWWYHAC